MGHIAADIEPGAGGSRELLRLAAPLVLSNAFWTIQLTVDRVMLSRQNSDAVGAAMAAAVLYWTPLALLQQTAGYATTFVAQYFGAGRPGRVGPAVWQAIHFSVMGGLVSLLALPLLTPLVALGGHSPTVQALEVEFLFCLCFATTPLLLIASLNSFFAGRGDTWPVLLINAAGTMVTAALDYAWIYGHWGFPEWGIAGAGWATVCGSWVSALVGFALMLRARHRRDFGTLTGWRLDRELFLRLMRFGLPGGLQYCLEALAFSIFLTLVGQLGTAQLTATSIAFTVNMAALVPMVGLAQAVSVLVGQRLGQGRPDLAARSTVKGVGWCLLYTLVNAMVFALLPGLLMLPFRDPDPGRWSAVAPLVPPLLKFVAAYCLFESISLILSSALRGAGDTRFVSAATLVFSWAIMVVPTVLSRLAGGSLFEVWMFATAYVIVLSLVFIWRFRQGKWRKMRVIEAPALVSPAPGPDDLARA